MTVLGSLVLVSAACGLGVLCTGWVQRWAIRVGIVNHPNPIVPQHTRAVAYLGGIGVALAGVLTLLLWMGLAAQGWLGLAAPTRLAGEVLPGLPVSTVVGGLFFLGLGTADDLRAFRPLPKLVLQGVGTVLFGMMSGEVPTWSGWPWLDGVLAGLWILTVVNAVNFTDVCDGLVGGLSAVMLVAFSLVNPDSAVMTLAFAGACLGFLRYNAPPASIFLGDAGSHLLGFLIATQALETTAHYPLWPALPILVLMVGVPLFELVFITVVRMQKGLPWWRGSPDHFALRMQAAGFSRWQTDAIAWTIAALLCIVAALLSFLSPGWGAVLLGGAGGLAMMSWRYLRAHEVQRPAPRTETQPAHL